jgi:hypothetical protein
MTGTFDATCRGLSLQIAKNSLYFPSYQGIWLAVQRTIAVRHGRSNLQRMGIGAGAGGVD